MVYPLHKTANFTKSQAGNKKKQDKQRGKEKENKEWKGKENVTMNQQKKGL